MKKFKYIIFGFVFCIIASLIYYLQKYYTESKLIFEANQFIFYIIFVSVVILCFGYLIFQNYILYKKINQLKEELTSCKYSILESVDNQTSVSLKTYKMLKNEVEKRNE